MSSLVSHVSAALAVTLVTTATGCLPDPEEEVATALVQSALQSADQQSQGRQVAEAASEDCSVSAAELAAEAAAAPVVGLYPASCVTKRAEGPHLQADYDHCNTAFGTSDISGGIGFDIESSDDCTLLADFADDGNLTDHGKSYTYAGNAVITVRPGERDVSWTDHFAGTTKEGQAIEQSGQWRFVYYLATGCYDFEGPAQGTLDGTSYDYEVTGMNICEDECPSRGTVVARWDDEYQMTVEFDGTDVAKVTGWSGREFEVEMICNPASAR